MCGSMVDIQSPTAEIMRGKKKKEDRNHRAKILRPHLFYRATIIMKKLVTIPVMLQMRPEIEMTMRVVIDVNVIMD